MLLSPYTTGKWIEIIFLTILCRVMHERVKKILNSTEYSPIYLEMSEIHLGRSEIDLELSELEMEDVWFVLKEDIGQCARSLKLS